MRGMRNLRMVDMGHEWNRWMHLFRLGFRCSMPIVARCGRLTSLAIIQSVTVNQLSHQSQASCCLALLNWICCHCWIGSCIKCIFVQNVLYTN